MKFSKIIKMFENENVCVCGKRGRGKDLLTANVIIRRKHPYVSNMNYGGGYNRLNFEKLNVGKNTYKDFLNGTIKRYEYPYLEGTDVYISDVGVYFPSQYCNELNRDYKQFPIFMALSRHLGNSQVHCNVQHLGRAWDKIREQSDCYILCRKCKYIKGLNLVIQHVTIYDYYDSALMGRKPLKLPFPIFSSRDSRMQRNIQLANYEANHGKIKNAVLIYRNKSNYNTRAFKEVLANGQ